MTLSTHERQILAQQFADQLIDNVKLDDKGLGEAEKALNYFCKVRNADQLLQLLRLRKEDTRFSQTRNTPGYYGQMLSAVIAFNRLNPGIPDEDMLYVFAWAIRLAKYRWVTSSGKFDSSDTEPNLPTQLLNIGKKNNQYHQQLIELSLLQQQVAPVKPSPTPKIAGPVLPTIGDIFGGEVLAIDTQGVRVKIKDLATDIAIGVIKTAALENKQYQIGSIARVEVLNQRTLANGLVVFDLKPGPKKEKAKDKK